MFVFPLIVRVVLRHGLFILTDRVFVSDRERVELPQRVTSARVRSFAIVVDDRPYEGYAVVYATAPFSYFVVRPRYAFQDVANDRRHRFAYEDSEVGFDCSLYNCCRLVYRDQRLRFLQEDKLKDMGARGVDVIRAVGSSRDATIRPIVPRSSINVEYDTEVGNHCD